MPVDELSALIGAVFTDALNALARRRDDGSLPDAFGDVRFADLMADPVAAIEGAYAQIGREVTDDHRSAIVAYLADKPRGKHGTHTYGAAEWGFDADARAARPRPVHRPLRHPPGARVATPSPTGSRCYGRSESTGTTSPTGVSIGPSGSM